MPKTNQKSNHETQSSELSDDSVGDILSSVDQFIENVYRNLDITPSHDASSRNSVQFQTRRSPNVSISPMVSPAGAASLSFSSTDDNRESVVSPSSRRLNIDAEVERINLMCDRVERNLRSIGVFMNHSGNRSSSEDRLSTSLRSSPTSSTTSMSVLNLDNSAQRATSSSRDHGARETVTIEMPRPIIDLSESRTDTPLRLDNTNSNNDEDEDDDVIIVSSNLQPIVDLCTPLNQRETSTRRRRHTVNHTTLNRRRLPMPSSNNDDSCIEDGPSTARKRRMGNRRKALDVSTTASFENDSSAVNISSDRSPYTCAVCLESYFQRQPTTTRCGHVFCLACISEAIRLTHKCPMCNARVGRNQIHRLYL